MESKRLKFSLPIFFLGLILLFVSVQKVSAQNDEQINKAVEVFFNKGYSEGIAKLQKYMDKARKKNSGHASLSAYETWVEMEYLYYLKMEELYSGIEITVDAEAGDTLSIDSTAIALLESFKNIPKENFINICRQSTIWSSSSVADMHLRKFFVDYDPDTLMSDKAKEYLDEGDEFYKKEDYELAELNYRKALNEDSTFYRAYLNLGITFWAREDYDSAMVYFTIAKNMHPNLLDPRQYMVDALIEKGLFFRAKKECFEALCVYAGFDMKVRMQRILRVENKRMITQRFYRNFYPNDVTNDDQPDLYGIWNTYRLSKSKISRYCSDDGIIEANGETDDIYLEVYSWRRFFEKHEDELPDYLTFGHKMMEEGFLEPYVFISLFHIDIYPQFKHYMSFEENRKKSIEFIEKYCIESIPDELR